MTKSPQRTITIRVVIPRIVLLITVGVLLGLFFALLRLDFWLGWFLLLFGAFLLWQITPSHQFWSFDFRKPWDPRKGHPDAEYLQYGDEPIEPVLNYDQMKTIQTRDNRAAYIKRG